MGFTIGAKRQFRLPGPDARRSRRSGPAGLSTAVAEYTGVRGWDVVPGARAVRRPGALAACSCGSPACRAPGAHPVDDRLTVPAGATPEQARHAWSRAPGAAVLLPTGSAFDVLDVPAAAGLLALPRLERMGVPLGPVAAAPHGRAWFLVAPGAAAELPQLLYRMGWDGAALDLRALGPGEHITAPPSDHAGLGPVRWLRPPGAGGTPPPPARLLLGTLAYCSRRPHAA
ncbi:bifunctional DNA primase/polymerase [Streptomyces sp. DSM 44917]|uniref:Bifunctional DNA primase/polymerase n=1 Tax=Streptomyces boetiae TaxID=3075541 RepID=A0ABU2L9F8_9ACTN|nr:bifunctional DNA primase/polymerase [Streptomyces sp. DSM 44917]MDT0308208.1 bifunctional DNA primase/polymerase [Streptomyces sp. DSM 44917]